MNEQWRSRITIEPGKRGGRPCIRGMRRTVCDVLSYRADGGLIGQRRLRRCTHWTPLSPNWPMGE